MAVLFAPDSAIADAGSRIAMATSLPALLRRSDRVSRALAEALRTTAIGAVPAEERAWADRIEARRRATPNLIATAEAAERDPAEHLGEAAGACRWMSLPPTWGRLLMRLVRELAPGSCLELGTGFGISTAYQAAALELNMQGGIVGLDVERMTAIAADGLSALDLGHRVELRGGLIEETLAAALELAAPVDFALLDADHTERGTLEAFDAIAPHLAPGAVVVLDDIRWTDGMRRAWRAVGRRARVSATIDLRRVGIVAVS